MRLTLKSKVVLLALVPVVLFALVLSGAAAKVLQHLAEQEIKETRERLLQQSREELEHYIQIAMGSVQMLYDGAAQGDMGSREQAISILSKIKYGRDGYFFGHDSNVVRLFRGDSSVDVGKSLADRRDPNGVYTNRELVNVAKTTPISLTTARHYLAMTQCWCRKWSTAFTCPNGTWHSARQSTLTA